MPLVSTPNKPITMKLKEHQRGRYRKVDHQKYSDNYDKIFGKKQKQPPTAN
jgi:hypothetical protein